MASQGVAATSRLAQMQMKFQQKQMQEREQRRIEMTGEKSSDSSETSVPSKPFGNGKVRQMFDERRRGAGIDRSNPLKPIMSTAKSKTGPPKSNPAAPIRRHAGGMANSQANGRRNLGRSSTFEKGVTNNSNKVHSELDSECETFSKSFSSLSLAEHRTTPSELGDRFNHNHITPRSDLPRGQSSNSIKLKPVLTKKSPLASSTRNLNTSASPPVSASRTRTQRTETDSNSTPRKLQTSTGKTLQKSSGRMTYYNKMVEKQPPHTGPPPAGMATCRICGRNFNEDRLAKHEQVCLKMANSKRKIFDASKARVKGTEAEKYLKKPLRSSSTSKPTMTYTSSTAATGNPPNTGLKKNNWRKKHEEFIAAIRAAKQVQVHLAKGGKLKDLPPPPPSENPDYIQCPHCSRRFNQAAAERHIPKCATMLHNKPRPGAVNKRKP